MRQPIDYDECLLMDSSLDTMQKAEHNLMELLLNGS